MRGVIASMNRLIVLSTCVVLASCAVYRAKPLPNASDLRAPMALRVPRRTFGLPGAKPAPLDLAAGLSEVNVMQLAVAADPTLRAARARVGIARAQLFAAGLLPDPELSAGWASSPSRLGYSVGLMQDVRALVTLSATRAAAAAHERQVDLALLWQEWQVAERARVLFIRVREQRALARIFNPERHLLGLLVRRDQDAVARGDVSAARAATRLAAWSAVQRRWRALELAENRTWHGLDALLALRPGTRLRLQDTPATTTSLSAEQVRAALATLPRRRPDLLALRAGYASGEQRLRAAILRQFPMLGLGVAYGHSADQGVRTIGVNVSLTLPLFNRNRGAIAIARATRAYLYRRYQAHVDAALNNVDRVFAAVQIMNRQSRALDARVTRLERAQRTARTSYQRGELTLAAYCRVISALDDARADAISLRASLDQARAALDMLLARPL